MAPKGIEWHRVWARFGQFLPRSPEEAEAARSARLHHATCRLTAATDASVDLDEKAGESLGHATGLASRGLLPPGSIRKIAVDLLLQPVPDLSRSELETRWDVGPDTVRRVLVSSVPTALGSSRIPFWDVLRCEGIADPLLGWAMAGEAERQILRADLMSFEAYARFIRETTGQKISGLQRELPRLPHASIRIGKQHRFRPSLRSLELLTGRAPDRGRSEGAQRNQSIPSVAEID
jgi:hypothetical protein